MESKSRAVRSKRTNAGSCHPLGGRSQPTLWGHASRVPGRGWQGTPPLRSPLEARTRAEVTGGWLARSCVLAARQGRGSRGRARAHPAGRAHRQQPQPDRPVGQLVLDEVGPEAQHLVQNGARHRSEAMRRHPFRRDVQGPERTVLSDLSPDYRRFGRACLDGPSKRPSSRIIGPGADRSSASILLGDTGNSTDGRSGSESHEHVVYVERHPGPSFRVLCDIVAPCLHDFAPARQQVRSHVRALGAAHDVSQHGFRRLAVHAGFGHPDTNRRSETVASPS